MFEKLYAHVLLEINEVNGEKRWRIELTQC